MRVFLLDATVWDPVDGSARAVRITDARLKTVWGGVAYEQLLVRPPSISVEAPFDGGFTGGSRTSVDEIEVLMPPEFDWLARLDWPETSVRLRMADDGAADGTLVDYGRFVIARITADERAVRLICKDWQAELTRPFLAQYDGSGGLGGEVADTGQYIPMGWGRVRQAPARFIDRAQLVMRFDRGPVGAVQAVRQRGILIPIEADHVDLPALRAAVIAPGQCRTCRALGLVRFRFTPGEPVTVDYLGSSQGGYVETLPSIAGRVAAAAGLPVSAPALASLSAVLTQPGGYLASDAATPAQAFDQLLAGVRAVWAIDWNAELTFGRIGFDNPVDIDEVLSVEISGGRPPSYEHKLGWGRNWRPLADGEVAEGITAADVAGLGALATQNVVDWDSQLDGDGKPENNATVGAPAGTLVGSIPAEWLHLGATDNVLFEEFTTYSDVSEIIPAVWLRRRNSVNSNFYFDDSGLWSGGRALRVANNSSNAELWITTARSIPFDPNATYKISAAIYQQSGAGSFFLGVEGRALDGVTAVNAIGENSAGIQHYVAAADVLPPPDQFVVYTGYFRGHGSPNGDGVVAPNIGSPTRLHANVRRVAPVIIGNHSGLPGDIYVDWVRLERLTDGYSEVVLNAQSAAARIADLANNNLITTIEKPDFVRSVNDLLTVAGQIISSATGLGLATLANSVTTARNTLTATLATYTTPVLWSTLTGDTTVNRDTLNAQISALVTAYADADRQIKDSINATASSAAATATAAAERLITLGSDSHIGQEEKAAFNREVSALLKAADQIVVAATNVGLNVGNPNWATIVTERKNNLTALLATYTTPSLWSDTTGDTNVIGSVLDFTLRDLNDSMALAQGAISTRASTTSNWSGVNNDTGGKPEDFATNDRGVDTRDDNFLPAYYRQNYPLRVRTEFKVRAAISAPGTAQFGALQTLAKWGDDSGGPVEQQFTSDNGVFYRRGTNAGGWGPWTTSFDTLNRPDISSGHLLNSGSQLAPGQMLNSSIVVNADGTTSYFDGVAWRNNGAVTIAGLGYNGDLNATRGADWSSTLSGRPTELTDGTVIDTRNRSSRLRTNGRANGNLLPTGNNSGVTSALLTAPITGLTSSSITIAPHTRYIFGSAIYYNGGTILGLSPSTRYYIYADDPDELGGAVIYLATNDFSAISGVNRIYFGPATTAAAGNPGGGGGGGGGELPPDEFCVDISMFVDNGLRAGAVMPGDQVWCMDDAGTPVGLRPITQALEAQAACLRLTAKNGAAVVVSESAPLWTLNRGLIRAGESELGDVVMTRLCQTDLLSPLVAVATMGLRRVRKIHVQGISYAAGVDAAALIYTHNPTYKP